DSASCSAIASRPARGTITVLAAASGPGETKSWAAQRTTAPATRRRRRTAAPRRRQNRRIARAYGGGAKISEALVPPNPNEFDRTWRILRSLAFLGTRSISQ